MAIQFSPESIFINVVSRLINIYKEKFGKKAEIKVKSKDNNSN